MISAPREPKLPGGALRLERAERVEVVTEKRPALADDEHAHDVEPDPDVFGVQVLGEVGSREPFERRAVRVLLGKSLAAVLRDLAVDEDQVVLIAGDEVGDVPAVRPALLQDLEAPALEVDPDALLGPGVDGFHDVLLSSRPAPVARLVACMPARFARVQGVKQNPEGSSFRKGALCPAKSFCDPCGHKRFPASLQESKESPRDGQDARRPMEALTQDQGEVLGCVAGASRALEDARAGNVALIATRDGVPPSARLAGLSVAHLEDVVALGVHGGGVHLTAQVDELLGQALHLVVKPLVDGATSTYPQQLPQQLQHALAQGAVHPDVRHHGDRLVVQPRHDEVLLAHAALGRNPVEPELLLRRHPEGHRGAPPPAVVRARHQMPALVASRARAISPCLSGKRCA